MYVCLLLFLGEKEEEREMERGERGRHTQGGQDRLLREMVLFLGVCSCLL